MFEIKCIVGDKKVTEVLKLLDGHTLEPPVVIPVHGGDEGKPNGKSHGMPKTPAPGNSSVDIMRAHLKGLKIISPKEMREFLMSRGYTANGYSYARQVLMSEGVLKRTKDSRTYEVKL